MVRGVEPTVSIVSQFNQTAHYATQVASIAACALDCATLVSNLTPHQRTLYIYVSMKIVVDTNVFIGACLGVGAANALVRHCIEGRLVPLMGNALYAEYEDVLSRANLFVDCRLSAAERDQLFDIFASASEWVHVYFQWRPNLRDEADNHLIELGVAGGASHLVTRNIRDVASGELVFPQLRIVTPIQFLKEHNL